MPTYHTHDGKLYNAPCESEECPVSVITPDARALLRITSEARAAFRGYGVTPANASDCRIHDALVLIEHCRNEEEAARPLPGSDR